MLTIAGTMRRLPVKSPDGAIDLIEMGALNYRYSIEAPKARLKP